MIFLDGQRKHRMIRECEPTSQPNKEKTRRRHPQRVPLINRRMPSFSAVTMASVILFYRSRSVIEEREFNTEGTKKNSRRTRSDRELSISVLLRVLRVEVHERSHGYMTLGTLWQRFLKPSPLSLPASGWMAAFMNNTG